MRLDVPPEGSKIRQMVSDRLAEAERAGGEKMTIEWRGEQKHLHVISAPVAVLYYNPDTHRIRAQRTLDPVRNRALDEEPFGVDGQQYLHDLLRCQPSDPDKRDPDFEALQEDLENFGQKDPGIITPTGILVNGNTRCAALRDLGEKYIRVGVLPESVTRDDVNSVELSLQLRKEFKREYSYINRLLAIEEQVRLGRRPEDIARDFRIRTATLEQDRWVFGVIQDAIGRSGGETEQGLRLVDFEDHQEKLREMHRAYKKAAAQNPEAAEALKESRLAMIVLGFSKTDVRLAQAGFHEKYLAPKLPDELKSDVPEPSPVAVPGLSITVPDSPAAVKTTRALTDKLLKAKAAAQAPDLSDASKVASATAKLKSAKESYERALEPAGKDARLRKRQVAAAERLSDAADLLELGVGDLAESLAKQALDEDGFEDAVLRVKGALHKLARQAKRTFPEPGQGVSWLLKSAAGEEK